MSLEGEVHNLINSGSGNLRGIEGLIGDLEDEIKKGEDGAEKAKKAYSALQNEVETLSDKVKKIGSQL